MLRALVVLLLLANLGLWAWREGWLAELGLAPASERDPARLAQQVRPDAVRVVSPAAAAVQIRTAGSGAGSTLACLEAGPFTADAADAAEQAIASALPAGSWQRNGREVTAQFGVVLGPFASREALQKKIEEVGRLRLAYEEITLAPERGAPAATLGIALGQHDSRAAAEAALANFSQRGLRTGRVAPTREAGREIRLRVDNAPPFLAEQLRGLSGAALGAGFAPCPVEVPRR